ncbi:MAG: hypothetical protein J5764_02175, partial [Bacteroidales bacterium]|nr:hypothetical protein [Bacteroidales bacterium]
LLWTEDTALLSAPPSISDNRLVVSRTSGHYGNALVGIYSQDDELLWSYHIWCPQESPDNLLLYNKTYTQSREVMPMALGAMKSATASDSDSDKLDACGLYYQWGRKDPMGRPSGFNSSTLKTIYDASGNAIDQTSESLNKEDMEETLWENLGNNAFDYGLVERVSCDFAVANPMVFINNENDMWDYTWHGNPESSLWEDWHKTVFDPCPAGYRIAPRDLYVNFDKNNRQGSFSNGSAWYYQNQGSGPVDFYPAQGTRIVGGTVTYGFYKAVYWNAARTCPLEFNSNRVSAIPDVSKNYDYGNPAAPLRCVRD